MKNKLILLILIFSIFLSGCKTKIDVNTSKAQENVPEELDNQSEIEVRDIIKGRKLVAIGSEKEITIIDPEFAKPLTAYVFEDGQAPTLKNLETFLISPDNQWIAWYSPNQGVLALDIMEYKVKVVEEASDFLNRYPYMEFMGENELAFIVEDGNTLRKYKLDSDEQSDLDIPYPYGNVFKISPDEKSILFISGYGQSKVDPKFMFTDYTGEFSQQFETQTDLSDRNQVFWAPDSNGILLINESNLEFYSLINPKKAQVMFSLGRDNEIVKASGVGENIFMYSKKGYWHVYDYETRKEVARSPDGIAEELNKPKFVPWTKTEFIIEESLTNDGVEFNRLWLSDFRGNKKILVPRYNDLIVKTELERIE